MSQEAILPQDSRWAGPKLLIPRGQGGIEVISQAGTGNCQMPPGPDALVLSADNSSSTFTQLRLNFRGTGVTLFGANFATSASIALTSIALTGAATPYGGPPVPVKSLANCDYALFSASDLTNGDYTLTMTLEAQGQLFIYNATITATRDSESTSASATFEPTLSHHPSQTHSSSPTSTSLTTTSLSGPSTPSMTMNMPNTPRSQYITARLRLALFIALPIICIVVLTLGLTLVWLRRRRRKRRPAVQPYPLFSPDTGTDPSRSGAHDRKLSFLTKEELPRRTQGEAGSAQTIVDAGQISAPLSDLERAVEQAGFSVTALVTSLRLVQSRAGQADIDADHPPGYAHPAER